MFYPLSYPLKVCPFSPMTLVKKDNRPLKTPLKGQGLRYICHSRGPPVSVCTRKSVVDKTVRPLGKTFVIPLGQHPVFPHRSS